MKIIYFYVVKYLSFRNSSFALRYLLMLIMARPRCDTPLVLFGYAHMEKDCTLLAIYFCLKFDSICELMFEILLCVHMMNGHVP